MKYNGKKEMKERNLNMLVIRINAFLRNAGEGKRQASDDPLLPVDTFHITRPSHAVLCTVSHLARTQQQGWS